jgi:DEAD/DEAH box helicase domain-containing protein
MENLFGIDQESIEVITSDGAPSGSKDVILWRPRVGVEVNDATPTMEATRLMRFLMKRGIRVILFCKASLICQQIAAMLTYSDSLPVPQSLRTGRLHEEMHHKA